MKKPGELRLTMQLVLQGNITIGYGQVPVLSPILCAQAKSLDAPIRGTTQETVNFTRSGCPAVQVQIEGDEYDAKTYSP